MKPMTALQSAIPMVFRTLEREGWPQRMARAGRLFAVLLVLFLVCGGARAQGAPTVELTPQELAWRAVHPVVNVGVFAGDHLPAETWVAGLPEGYGVDYASLLAGKVGLRLEFHPYADWAAVAYADRDQPAPYDLLLGQLSTEDGRTRFDFLRPYESGHLMLVARKGDLQIRSERDLDRARIVIERPFQATLSILSAKFPQATLVFANDGHQAMDMLAAGQADAYIGTTASRTQALLNERKTDDLRMLVSLDTPPMDMGLAVPHDRAMLFQLLRKAEAAVTPEEVGRLQSRWGLLGNGSTPVPLAQGLTTADRAWLSSLPTLRVGFEVDRHPYSFVDNQGKFNGLAADYVDILQRQLGLRLQFVPAQDLQSLQRMVGAREVDIVAATMPEDFSAQDMIFSRPYAHFPEVIVARLQGPPIAGVEDLAGHSVALREEAGLLPRFKMLLPRSTLLPVGSNEEGLELVASRKADAYIGTLPAIDPFSRDRYAATLRVVGPAGVDQDFTVGVSSAYGRLAPLIDHVLGNVSETASQTIRSRWLTAEYRYGVPLSWVIAGLLISALVLGIILFAYSRLRLVMRARAVAERELETQLAFQQALLETIPYPVFLKDADGQYLAVNGAYEKMFACSRTELIGHTPVHTRHVKGFDATLMRQIDLEVISSGKTLRRELRLTNAGAGGPPRDVIVWLHPFFRRPGEHACLLGTLVDVSDIREAEARARASEEHLIVTNDSLPGVVLRTFIDKDGERSYDHVSGQTEALFGMSHQDILSGYARPLDAALPEDRAQVLEVINKMIDTRSAGIAEFRVRVNDQIRWIRGAGGVPRTEANGGLSWSVYCDDVTTEKEQASALAEAKAVAEAAVATKSIFLATMSHEIRTPMASVLGLIELLAHTHLDREQRHMLGMVQDSAGALLQILDDLLDFSRIESGRLELEAHPFDLRALADGVVGLFAARSHEKGVRIYSPLDWRLAGEYIGDAVRIRQVIINLLSNALKFTERGHVELCMELLGEDDGGQRLRISVNDTGIGISPEQLGRLFQPFTQAETSTTRRFGGTGLGLTICQRLATLMGGEIRLLSSPGLGTQAIFEFTLPVARASQPPTIIAGKTALLCTHNAMLERELSNTLSALGLNLVEADAGDLPDFDASDFDLFVVDTDIVKEGLLPHGARCIRLVDSADPLGFSVEDGSVVLCCNPLLWRYAMDACHAALGLPLPESIENLSVGSARHDARILVAEDHPINRAVISRQLVRLGYAHTLVENGEQALAALANAHYDLLITDCHMPVMDGYALTKRIRSDEVGGKKHLPIIALSASALPEQIQRCQEAGMDDFIAKPVQIDEIGAILAVHLRAEPTQAEPAQKVLPTPSTIHSGGGQLAHLMEVFGSTKKMREVLRGMLDTGRQDLAGLDRALQVGDVATQRDLLHRIDGSLCLLGDGWDRMDFAQGDFAQQRNAQARRLDVLETLLHDMEKSYPSDDTQG